MTPPEIREKFEPSNEDLLWQLGKVAISVKESEGKEREQAITFGNTLLDILIERGYPETA